MNFGLHWIWGIFSLAEEILAFQEEFIASRTLRNFLFLFYVS
jgi:hypothetical protein